MKQIVLFLASICLASCTADSLLETEGAKTPLEIKVDIAAYNQDISGVASRTVTKGVMTTFSEGDAVGLFVIDKTTGDFIAQNYKYVVQKSGILYRVDETGKVIASDVYDHANYTYFAYAPYHERYKDCKSVDEIVAVHKDAYRNQKAFLDQSTAEKYSAADLLVCREPQKSGHSLRLSFTHAMSLLRVFYNGEASELAVEKPVALSYMLKPGESASYSYICIPADDVEVYGTAESKTTVEDSNNNSETVVTGYSYWQANVDLLENHSTYVTISTQPTESYKTAGVDMGLPSGCIWANHNLGTETAAEQVARGGAWYDADGNELTELMASDLHACFDRGDYFSWGELATKYGKPSILLNENGRIKATGDAIVTASNGTQSVTPLISGSDKGYYPETYIDRDYDYANIDGSIAGTEYDVVRNKLWKGEWRIPNESEVDELMRNCDISVHGWYYEDNVRYAGWIAEKDAEGNYVNLHPDNSEFWGTAQVRPYRYLITIFKFTSKINGEVLYFPGGAWSDWSIDMLSCASRSPHGLMNLGTPDNPQTPTYHSDYGGMYYFASSASHDHRDCSSYMELETRFTFDESGKITDIKPVLKKSTYTDSSGTRIELWGLTQNGHRYTGMLIRPVYGGKNWNTNPSTRNIIQVNVETR